MADAGLGHSPLKSQFSGEDSSELQRALSEEEREEKGDSGQEGNMSSGS